MKLNEIIDNLKLQIKTEAETGDLNKDITHGYSSDLLSDIMANAIDGSIWITLQIHQNIIAVAALKSLSGIILINNREPDPATLEKANKENIPIMTTELSTFDTVGKLYALGIKGS